MASQLPTIKLYWLNQSRSHRIAWLLEELALPYELIIYHRDPKTRLAPPELKDIHPLGKSPVISIAAPDAPPDQPPLVLAESGLIVEYLIDHYGQDTNLVPQKWQPGRDGAVAGETEAWLRSRYYMHFSEGSLMPFLVIGLLVSAVRNAAVPFFIKPITRSIAANLDNFLQPNLVSQFSFLNSQLATSPDGGKYLCGDHLTGADIIMSFPLIAARIGGSVTKEKYPQLYEYVERLEQEPGYKTAVQKIVDIEGKFEALL